MLENRDEKMETRNADTSNWTPSQEEGFALSYSSGTTIETCEYKYACHKVWNLIPDREDDTTALRWGKACHQIMEDTDWVASNFTKELFHKALVEQGFARIAESGRLIYEETGEQPCYAIYSACQQLFKLFKKQKMTTVKCEHEIKLPYLYGFIDQIIKDSKGHWWIRDLKTSGQIRKEELGARLIRDRQLTLYALPQVIQRICDTYHLEADKFQGVRYTVVFKTKAKVKMDAKGSLEKLSEYAERNTPNCLDYEIPANQLDVETIYKEHMKKVKQGLEIRTGKREPKRSYGSACFAFNRPCNYFSRCYGVKAEDVAIKTIEADKARALKPVITCKDKEENVEEVLNLF